MYIALITHFRDGNMLRNSFLITIIKKFDGSKS